jgi:hypothetical protein
MQWHTGRAVFQVWSGRTFELEGAPVENHFDRGSFSSSASISASRLFDHEFTIELSMKKNPLLNLFSVFVIPIAWPTPPRLSVFSPT